MVVKALHAIITNRTVRCPRWSPQLTSLCCHFSVPGENKRQGRKTFARQRSFPCCGKSRQILSVTWTVIQDSNKDTRPEECNSSYGGKKKRPSRITLLLDDRSRAKDNFHRIFKWPKDTHHSTSFSWARRSPKHPDS